MADLLAAKDDWAPLYDASVLSSNRVPAAALSYVDDLYVDYNLSMVGAVRSTQPRTLSLLAHGVQFPSIVYCHSPLLGGVIRGWQCVP